MSELAASGDASILNTCVTPDSPGVVDPADIQKMLNFVKEYKDDEKLQSTKNMTTNLQPKGIAAWSSVPAYIDRKVRNKIWDLDGNDIPSSADLAKCLNPGEVDQPLIDYDEFLVMHSNFPESIQNLYDPHIVWQKLISEADEQGRLPISTFHNIYSAKIDLLRYRTALESFSFEKPGYLSHDELVVYIATSLNNNETCASQPSITNIAAEAFAKIIFFKASSGTQKFAKITDILVSGLITTFDEAVDSDDVNNYLSLAAVYKIYDRFTSVEPNDLYGLNRYQVHDFFESIVPAFWDRYFELYCPDDKMYLIDFYILSYMLDNLLDPNVVRIFFRAMDIDDDGIFSINDYKVFHSQLMPAFCLKYGKSYSSNDVYTSLFDLASAKNEITLKNLIDIQRFDEFFGMACDIKVFASLEDVAPYDDDTMIEAEAFFDDEDEYY